MKKQNEVNKTMRELAPYMNLGLQSVMPIIGGVFFGIWLDKRFESTPLWTLIFSFLGIALGIFYLIKSILFLSKKKPK